MLTNGLTTLLIIAAVAAVAIAAYEYENRRKTIYGMAYNANRRIMPSGVSTLYAANVDAKTCRDKVDGFHAAGTPLGGFDYGTDADGKPACHIYGGPMTATNHSLATAKGYTAYVGPNHASPAAVTSEDEPMHAFLPAPHHY